MKIVFRLILFAALLALGVWLWFVLFPGPEKIISKRLAELARTVPPLQLARSCWPLPRVLPRNR